MAKFNVTVELDWIDDENGIDIDDVLKSEIVDGISSQVIKMAKSQTDRILTKAMDEAEEQINTRLNGYMEEFFSAPKTITNKWGEIERENVTVKQMLKEACDNFMSQKVDSNGRVVDNVYSKAKTRVDYIAENVLSSSAKYEIDKVIEKSTKQIKEWIQESLAKKLGKKISDIIGLDELLGELKL